MISQNLARVQSQITSICQRLGRNPQEITLVGVTKYADPVQIKEAIDAGLAHIGENKVQMAQEKFPQLDQWGLKVTKHLIGHLQMNKAKHAVQFFDLIHSVESLRLPHELAKQAQKINKTIDILVQVSTSGEGQKFGLTPNQTIQLIEEILKLSNIRILGLMTMAPYTENQDIIRQCFHDLRVLRDQVQKQFPSSDKIQMKYLSMGMSSDYEIALEEGSNMVRIGTAIFK